MWNEITYQLSNFNDAAVEVWNWIRNSIPHFPVHVTTYPCCYNFLYPSWLLRWHWKSYDCPWASEVTLNNMGANNLHEYSKIYYNYNQARHNWWLVSQKQVSRAGTSNYIPQNLWDVITCFQINCAYSMGHDLTVLIWSTTHDIGNIISFATLSKTPKPT